MYSIHVFDRVLRDNSIKPNADQIISISIAVEDNNSRMFTISLAVITSAENYDRYYFNSKGDNKKRKYNWRSDPCKFVVRYIETAANILYNDDNSQNSLEYYLIHKRSVTFWREIISTKINSKETFYNFLLKVREAMERNKECIFDHRSHDFIFKELDKYIKLNESSNRV